MIKRNDKKFGMKAMGLCVGSVIAISMFILCNVFFYNYIWQNSEIIQSGQEYVERETIECTPAFSNSQDCVEQKFFPMEKYLKEIKIRFGVGWAGLTEAFVLQMELKKDGEVLYSEQFELYDQNNWRYYDFNVEQRVLPNEEYVVSIRQIRGVDEMPGLSYTVFEAAEHVKENEEFYYYNGEQHEGEFDVCYVYEKLNEQLLKKMLYTNAGFVILLLAAFAGRLTVFKRSYKKITYILYGIFPVLLYVLCENILGNFSTITMENHLKSLLIYYVLYFLITMIINHLGGIFLGYGCTIVILTLVQYFTTLFRGRPLYIHDLLAGKTAMTVVGNYQFFLDVNMYICLMIFVLVVSFGVIFSDRIVERNRAYKTGIISAVALLMIFLHSKWMVSVNMWYISSTYQSAGNVLTMVSQIPYAIVRKPNGYSGAEVKKITNIHHDEDDNSGGEPTNIILIMNESFSDLEYIDEIAADIELLPNWKGIQENAIKGYLYMPVFGAGTANSEYEVLTGNELEFMPQGVTAYQMNVKEREISLVSLLEEQGYKTIAMHPYGGENWNRNNVYDYMGVDCYYSEENWGQEREILRWTTSDRSAYDKVISVESASREKQFIFLVTMQNHGGYASEWDNFQNEVNLNYKREYLQTEQYLSLMQESDRALKELLDYYEKSDEPTMIVLFGDHQAAIEEEFYEELYGKSLKKLTFEEKQSRYVTPFVIWTNYDIEEQDEIEMSSNYFGSYILKNAGVKLSKYNEFLLDTMQDIPIIGIGGVKTKEGIWYKWEDIPMQYEELINNYKILQYNNIFDRKNRVESVFAIQ